MNNLYYRLQLLLRPGSAATTISILTLVILLAAAAGTIRTGRWYFRALLIAGALAWPLPDHPWQGPVVVELSYNHGIHLADLLSVLALVIAVLPWRRPVPAADRHRSIVDSGSIDCVDDIHRRNE